MLIAIDLETHLTTEHEKLPRPVCMSIVGQDGAEALAVGLAPITDALRDLCDSPHTIVAFNGANFDFPVLAKWCDSVAVQNALRSHRMRCALLWSQLADFARGINHSPNGEHHGDGQGYGLAAVVKRMWGALVDKGADTWRLRYAELENVPLAAWPAEATTYVMNDSRWALAIALTLPDVPDVARKTRQFFWLSMSSAKGAHTDVIRAKEWRTSLESDLAAYAPHLLSAGILRADGTRNLEIIRKRIEASSANVKRTPEKCCARCEGTGKSKKGTVCGTCAGSGHSGGAISADKEACSLSNDPIVRLYSLFVQHEDKLAKEVITVEAGTVHTWYRLVESGRTSSSKPPLQNIGVHSLARKCFTARPGFLYVVTDYGMLELCCMAQLCNVMGCGDTLGTALRAGKDVHTMLALQIDPTGDPKAIRRLAKEGNFGRNGGMGWKRLIETAHKRGIELTEGSAKQIIAAHKKQWPEIATYGGYHTRVKEELARTGNVLAHYRSGRLRGGLSFTQGANTLFQGLGSEVNLDAFVLLSEEGLMPVLSVHDEFHNEVTSGAEVKMIGQICEAVGTEWLPYAPPKAVPKVVNDWSEAK